MKGAVMYLQLSAPALWFYVMAECLKRYLLAQVQSSLYIMPDKISLIRITVISSQLCLRSRQGWLDPMQRMWFSRHVCQTCHNQMRGWSRPEVCISRLAFS